MADKPRRDYGSGSIYQLKSGPWRVAYSFGTDRYGRRQRQVWQCRSAAAARRKLREVEARLRHGLPTKESRVTVAAYAEEWLLAVRPAVKPATFEQYRHLAKHLVHEFGGLPLARVTPADLRQLIARRTAQGYASRTIRGVLDVFRMMSRMAMSDGILTRNVAELVKPPPLVQKEPLHFTAEQARRFLEVAKDDELHSLFAVALGTGLRRGELLALQWRDVDLGMGTVTVRRSKTSAGIRVVPLPTFAAQALAAVGRRPGPIWQVSPSHVSRRVAALCEQAGLPRLTFHQLRHTAASLMLDAGVDPFVIRQIMGHTRLEMTQRYAKAGDELRRDAVERLGKAVGGTR